MEKPDVEALADADLLAMAGWYKEWPLWDCRALDAVDVDALSAIVAERQAWIAGSVRQSAHRREESPCPLVFLGVDGDDVAALDDDPRPVATTDSSKVAGPV